MQGFVPRFSALANPSLVTPPSYPCTYFVRPKCSTKYDNCTGSVIILWTVQFSLDPPMIFCFNLLEAFGQESPVHAATAPKSDARPLRYRCLLFPLN